MISKEKIIADTNTEPKGDWQVEGVNWLFDNPYGILGDDVGLGKTYQSLIASLYRPMPTLIICPAYLRDNWKKELIKGYLTDNN